MSDAPDTTAGTRDALDAARKRGPMRQLLVTTFGRWGARLGMVWIGLLAFAAVFAPLLANSHPIAMKTAAGVSSPLLEHLTVTDVVLLVGAIAGVAVWLIRPLGAAARWGVWVAILAATVVVGSLTIEPNQVVVYDAYREGLANKQIDWAVHTPIPYSPNDRLRDELRRTGDDPRLKPPSGKHLLGTTAEGADVMSRMIHASRIALTIGLLATSIAATIGIVVGGVMGYFSGKVDLIGMRLVEVFSAIPVIFLLIMIVAFYGRSLYLMTTILGLTGWVGYAIFTRAEFLRIRKMDYVQAARAAGLPLRSILFRHMLPNGITPVLVLASFGIAGMILTESTLSFIGLGLEDDPSWGQMLNEARSANRQWGLIIFPGLAIFLTVLAYNLVGEAMRDALDPHSKKGG